jgi:acetone carboxylase gamma subunit
MRELRGFKMKKIYKILMILSLISTYSFAIQNSEEHIHTAECGHNEYNEGKGYSLEAKTMQEKTNCIDKVFKENQNKYSDKELTKIILKECEN